MLLSLRSCLLFVPSLLGMPWGGLGVRIPHRRTNTQTRERRARLVSGAAGQQRLHCGRRSGPSHSCPGGEGKRERSVWEGPGRDWHQLKARERQAGPVAPLCPPGMLAGWLAETSAPRPFGAAQPVLGWREGPAGPSPFLRRALKLCCGQRQGGQPHRVLPGAGMGSRKRSFTFGAYGG